MLAVLDPEALLGLDDAAFRETVNRHVPRRSDPDGTVWKALLDLAVSGGPTPRWSRWSGRPTTC